MRTIDAEALLEKVKPIRVKIGGDKVIEMIPVESVVSAPTVSAEVESTVWMFDKTSPGRFICASCKSSITGDTVNGKYVAHNGFFPYKWCPMCGRKAE